MPRRNDPDYNALIDYEEEELPSKTQVKAAMHELQALGVALIEIPDSKLAALDMEDRLREAITEMRRLKNFEAIRRQSQYIGKMLRETDPEPFRRALAAYRLGHTRALQDAEKWRERLLADDAAATDWIKLHPASDAQSLRALIRNTRRELAQAQANGGDDTAVRTKGRFYRELFQRLRVALQDAADAADAETEAGRSPPAD